MRVGDNPPPPLRFLFACLASRPLVIIPFCPSPRRPYPARFTATADHYCESTPRFFDLSRKSCSWRTRGSMPSRRRRQSPSHYVIRCVPGNDAIMMCARPQGLRHPRVSMALRVTARSLCDPLLVPKCTEVPQGLNFAKHFPLPSKPTDAFSVQNVPKQKRRSNSLIQSTGPDAHGEGGVRERDSEAEERERGAHRA
jgi:hypothetical protein